MTFLILFLLPFSPLSVHSFIYLLIHFDIYFSLKETAKALTEQRNKGMKVIQEKMKLNQKEVKRFNPVSSCPALLVHRFSSALFIFCFLHAISSNVIFFQIDAFPGDIVIFSRVLNLLRGVYSNNLVVSSNIYYHLSNNVLVT